MNAARPDWKARRPSSSKLLEIDGSLPGARATFRMTAIAACVGLVASETLPDFVRIWPPADVNSELNHTVRPSYFAAWTSMARCPDGSDLVIWIISDHVAGGFGTRSLRYQSSWVAASSGPPYIRPL